MPNTGNHHRSENNPVSFVTTRHAAFHQLPGKQPNENPPFVVASNRKYLLAKRLMDVTVSTIVTITILSWLIPILALLVRLNSKGPVFFIQKRIGLHNKSFSCYKLRTMHHRDTEQDEAPAAANDERVTGVGRFLRKTCLDELPQFINVLKGEMSIIGPRPHMTTDCIRFSFVIPSYRFRHMVKPGITGWAQVRGFHGPAPDYDSIIQRFYWDVEYIRKANALLDAKIIFLTLMKISRALIQSSNQNRVQ